MYFLILLIYNSFFFFSEHFSVPTTGLPPILAAIEHTQILSSLSPLSSFSSSSNYLHALPSQLYLWCPPTVHLSWKLPGGRNGTSSGLTSNQATGLSEEVHQAPGLCWEVEVKPHYCRSCEHEFCLQNI